MRRNGSGVGSAGKIVESQVPLRVCARKRESEIEKEEGRGWHLGLRAQC